MARHGAFVALLVARLREFLRESEAIFWTFVFPVGLSVALGLAFRNRPPEALAVAVASGPRADAVAASLRSAPTLRVSVLNAAEAARALSLGKVAVLVTPEASGVAYRFDPSRPDAALARDAADAALQRAAGRLDPLPTRVEEVSEPGARYIDFLIPGLIGLNIMSGGLWGVGFALVDMRIKRLLKRLLATPMRRSDLMAAQIALRLLMGFVEVGFLLAFGRIAFGVPVRGSWLAVLALGALGALCFGGMGVLAAARANRLETIIGITNLVTMPMMIGSGVFFSVDRFPEAAQPVLRALPLTALIDAMRAVVLEGATLASQGARVGVIAAWGCLSFALGLRWFRWS